MPLMYGQPGRSGSGRQQARQYVARTVCQKLACGVFAEFTRLSHRAGAMAADDARAIGFRHQSIDSQRIALDLRVSGQRHLARTAPHPRAPALGSRTRCRVGASERLEPLCQFGTRFENFYAQRPLPSSRQTDVGTEQTADTFAQPQAAQTCRRQNDGVVFAPVELAQAGVEIATQRLDPQLRVLGAYLRLA